MNDTNESKQPGPGPVSILMSADHRFVAGFLVAACSALDFRKAPRRTVIHVLDTGLSAQDREAIGRAVLARPKAEVRFHPVDFAPIRHARPYWNGGLAPYARLLFDRSIPSAELPERFLYFDTDMLVLRDCGELFDLDLGGNVAAMCRKGALSVDCPFADQATASRFPYFNSGTLLLDVSAWLREKLGDQAIALVGSHGDSLRFWDQTVLNWLLKGRILPLEKSWNWKRPHCLAESDVEYHYASGKKPWTVKRYRQTDDLWWRYFRLEIARDFRFRFRWWSKWNLATWMFAALATVPTGMLRMARTGRFGRLAAKLADRTLVWREWRRGGQAANLAAAIAHMDHVLSGARVDPTRGRGGNRRRSGRRRRLRRTAGRGRA